MLLPMPEGALMKHFALISLLSISLLLWTLYVFHEYSLYNEWNGADGPLVPYVAALYARRLHALTAGAIVYIALVIPILAHAIASKCSSNPAEPR
jgi:hypothetical protein